MKSQIARPPFPFSRIALIFLARILISSFQLHAQPCTPPPANLVSWWRAEGNTLDSAGTNNGTLVGGTSFVPGEVGQAFSFNGSGSAVSVGNAASLQLQNFTIEAWVRLSSTTISQDCLIFSYGYEGYGFGVSHATGNLLLSQIGSSEVTVSAGLTDTNWHHVAVAYNGGTVVFYIDGVAYPAPAYAVPFFFGTPAAIGARGDNYGNVFNGSIDELSIYSRALAVSEIQAIYAAKMGKCPNTPPVITNDPQSQTAAVGANVNFSVNVSGTPPFSYQWLFGGSNIMGSTNATLNLTNVQFANAGDYSVTITNAYGSKTSSNAVLTLGLPPTITTPPTNSTNVAGTTATFSVAAGGDSPLAYQWSFSGGSISGATSSVLSLSNVQSANAGNYSVTVTNAFGSVISSNATLTVVYPPAIMIQPADQTILVDANCNLYVIATGTSPLSYQWSFNGGSISGATNSSLALSDVQYSQAGVYEVTVTNVFGSITSSNATVTVTATQQCTPLPSGIVSWWKGENNALDSASTNSGTLAGIVTYVPGEVGEAFNFNEYVLGVGNDSAVSVGNPASLQLQNFTIEAWVQRASAAMVDQNGQDAMIFSFGNNGYGFGLDHATGNLLLTKVGINEVEISAGLTDTNWHHVAVTINGGTVVFYIDGVAYPAAPYNPGFSFSTPAAIGARGDFYNGYHYGFYGSIDELSVYNRALAASEVQAIYNAASTGKCPLAPVIVTEPTNQVQEVGGTAAFSVLATGTALYYQWNFNGGSISGATNSSLVLTGLQTAASGNYSVVISNAVTSVTSQTVMLSVLTNTTPVITLQPQAQPPAAMYMPLDAITLSVSAVGVPPLSYQWYQNGAAIGQTGPTIGISQLTPDTVGSYYVVVSNATGSVTSSNVVLSLIPNTVVYFQDFPSGTTMVLAGGAAAGGGGISFPPQSSATTPMLDVHNGGMISFSFGIPRGNVAQPGGGFGWGGYGIGGNYLQPPDSYLYNGPQLVQLDIPRSSTTSGDFTFSFGSEIETDESFAYLEDLLIASFVPPVVTGPPQSLTVAAGESATFSVVAEGDHSMTYQWQFNGINLTGATNSTLTLPLVNGNQAGNYSVLVSNSLGFTNSPNATLTVTGFSLGATVSGGNLNMQWPAAASGFIVETTTSLTPPATWLAVTNVPVVDGTNNVLSLPMTNTTGYYRGRISIFRGVGVREK